MITGNGSLALRDGRSSMSAISSAAIMTIRDAGYLLCEVSKIDRVAFYQRPLRTCDDGTVVVIAVMQSSGRHQGVIGPVWLRGT